MLPNARPLFPTLALASLCSLALGDPNPPVTPQPIAHGVTYTAHESDGRKTQNVRVIVFDANPAGAGSSPCFISPMPTLEDGQPAEIRVYNLNSFTNTYDVSFCREDFHGGGMPSALGNLVVASHEASSRALPSATAPTYSKPSLTTDSAEFQRSYEQYLQLIGPMQTCATSITDAIEDRSATNTSIRYAATQAVAALFPYEKLPQTSAIADNVLIPNQGEPVAVVDYGPDQQAGLNVLLADLRNDDTSKIAAAHASMKIWSDQWNKDYASNSPDNAQGPDKTPGAAKTADANPPAPPTAEDDTRNDEIQQQEAFADNLKDGQDILQSLIAIYAAAIDQSATPPYAVIKVDAVTDADVEEAQVTVSGKPPTGTYAQTDLDNTRIGIPGATSTTYTADASVYGRSVLDFSGGIVLSTLQNKNYYLTSTKIVRQGPSDSVDITFGALATYYKTQKSGLSVGPSLGVSVGSSTRYLLGLSLIAAIQRSRLLLTVGGASGYVNQLGDGDSVNQVAPSGAVATNSVQRFGGFVGLTWSIFVE